LLAAVVFLVGAAGLRAYLDWLTGTGYTYGALAAPIAFLLATFFIGLAIVLGAHFNAQIQALWPVPLRDRRNRMARAVTAAGAPKGTVMSEEVPEVLYAPDVAVLERAVRERPDVAAAVLEQMRYGRPTSADRSTGDGAGEGAGEGAENGGVPGPVEGSAARDGGDGASAQPAVGDRR
jgi:membrane protein